MSRLIEEVFQSDFEKSREKARRLFKSVVREKIDWEDEAEARGSVRIKGQQGEYLISSHYQTAIYNLKNGRQMASACLQLTVPAPVFDRMLAEYLLLKNDENFYWRTANIFRLRTAGWLQMIEVFLIPINFFLFTNLLLKVLEIAKPQ